MMVIQNSSRVQLNHLRSGGSLGLLIASLAFAATAHAQSASDQPPATAPKAPPIGYSKAGAEQFADEGTETVSSEGPADNVAFGPTGLPNFQLEANEAGTSGIFSFAIGGVDSKSSTKKQNFYVVSRTNFTLKASFPISTNNEGTEAFNFGKLGNFEKIEAAITYYSSRVGPGNGNGRIYSRAQLSCANSVVSPSKFTDPVASKAAAEFLLVLNNEGPENSGLFATLLTDESPIFNKDQFVELRKIVITQCVDSISDGLGFVKTYLGDGAYEQFRSATFDSSAIKFAGFNADIGRQQVKYVDTANFIEIENTRTPWSLNAFAGLIGSDYSWSARANYTYINKFDDADEGEFCLPNLDPMAEEDCLTGPLGEPTEDTTSLVSLEVRKRFRFKVGNGEVPLAIAPQVTFDFDENEFGIDVPVYLTSNNEGQLNGGIRFGYRSDDKDFAVGIFIGAPLQIPF
jgi:hypothetical protein